MLPELLSSSLPLQRFSCLDPAALRRFRVGSKWISESNSETFMHSSPLLLLHLPVPSPCPPFWMVLSLALSTTTLWAASGHRWVLFSQQSIKKNGGREPVIFKSFFLFSFSSYLFFGLIHSMQDLSSLTRNQTCVPCSGSTVLTTGPPGKSLAFLFYKKSQDGDIFEKQVFRGSGGKESACNAGDPSSIPISGRSPGEGNSYPLQYSCLENYMDRGAWQATVHGVAESDTTDWLNSVSDHAGLAALPWAQGQSVLSRFASVLGAPYCPPAFGEPQLQIYDGFCSETYEFSHQVGCVKIINSLLFIQVRICSVCICWKFTNTFWNCRCKLVGLYYWSHFTAEPELGSGCWLQRLYP